MSDSLAKKIIDEMNVNPTIDPADEINHRVTFIKYQLKNSGFKILVLGISGGVDSSVCGRLCQLAVESLRQETTLDYKFIAVRLPYSIQKDEEDAQKALNFIEPDEILTVNIKESVNGVHQNVLKQLKANNIELPNSSHVDFVKGNTKARIRMTTQFEIAGLLGGLVPGTDHSAENVMGFYTKYGDGACDFAPLFGLNKRQIQAIGKRLGAAPELFKKEPTADLEDLKPLLSDEDALGVTYNQIDDFLEGKKVSEEVQKKIVSAYVKTQHKRVAIPTPTHVEFNSKELFSFE